MSWCPCCVSLKAIFLCVQNDSIDWMEEISPQSVKGIFARSGAQEAGTSHPGGWIPVEKQQLLLKYVGAEKWHPLGGSDSD